MRKILQNSRQEALRFSTKRGSLCLTYPDVNYAENPKRYPMNDIEKEVTALRKMTTGQLRERYADLFGEKARSRHKTYLIRRIVWRIQALAEGGLSERARRRAEELADETDVRVTPPRQFNVGTQGFQKPIAASTDHRLPAPGTAIVRKYKGQTLRVLVHQDGLEYEGTRYKSLSAVAKAITGSHCNGYRFFRLEGQE